MWGSSTTCSRSVTASPDGARVTPMMSATAATGAPGTSSSADVGAGRASFAPARVADAMSVAMSRSPGKKAEAVAIAHAGLANMGCGAPAVSAATCCCSSAQFLRSARLSTRLWVTPSVRDTVSTGMWRSTASSCRVTSRMAARAWPAAAVAAASSPAGSTRSTGRAACRE
ncbi:MAG: hypothetical protein J3K34DRAFT_442902 [Monoraphidium minutum]|nr:MAG: hypothetical protein J3K34DRAFT_442902 [Monoraphidium minutum]